jgi:LysM repeat protein
MKTRARRSPLRVLAPLSLIAFGVAFVFVLSNSKIEKHPARAQQSTTAPAGTTAPAVNKFAHRRTYTVRTGDTLGSIAEKTSVPVATLEDLNQGLDPQALVAGQKIKLRE